MELANYDGTYNESVDIFLLKNIGARARRQTKPTGIFEFKYLNLLIYSCLPTEVKVNRTNDDIKLRSNSTINNTVKFLKNLFSKHY